MPMTPARCPATATSGGWRPWSTGSTPRLPRCARPAVTSPGPSRSAGPADAGSPVERLRGGEPPPMVWSAREVLGERHVEYGQEAGRLVFDKEPGQLAFLRPALGFAGLTAQVCPPGGQPGGLPRHVGRRRRLVVLEVGAGRVSEVGNAAAGPGRTVDDRGDITVVDVQDEPGLRDLGQSLELVRRPAAAVIEVRAEEPHDHLPAQRPGQAGHPARAALAPSSRTTSTSRSRSAAVVRQLLIAGRSATRPP